MVDWWALGVLCYECVCSCTPFVDEDEDCGPEIIFGNILLSREQDVDLPSRLYRDTSSFILDCLKFSPGKRLGIGGASQVKGHHIFASFDWEALEAKRMRAPYRPRVKSEAELKKKLNKYLEAKGPHLVPESPEKKPAPESPEKKPVPESP